MQLGGGKSRRKRKEEEEEEEEDEEEEGGFGILVSPRGERGQRGRKPPVGILTLSRSHRSYPLPPSSSPPSRHTAARFASFSP